ncbi:MAG: CHASE2 domain-containing protein [Chitinophagaceae bacterium]|nr:CHASE2 domain-containing protein [Chitinophagaceae bacterium]
MKKPLHKHIGYQARKMHGHFTKYLYERDTIFATIWVFLFIIILGSIPLNLGSLNPIKLGLKDLDMNDMSYSKLGKAQNTPIDTSNIVVINIGQADREGIAAIINKTASFKPKVMGLDVIFNGPRDAAKDSLLREAIQRNKNLVVAVKIETDSSDKLIPTENFFLNNSSYYGYVNFPNDDKETVRYYFPFKKDDHDKQIVLPSFSSSLVKLYDTTAYNKIKKKADSKVIVNYTRNVTERKKQYLVIEGEDLLMDNIDSSAINGRIALLAYVNLSPNDIEDKKFTPMNEKFAGKSHPDMNGIFVHANIISMVLEKNYVKKLPSWVNWLISVLVCWLFMSFFIRYYLESHIWFHLVAKIIQVASAILFVWLGIHLFDRYRLKVDMKMSLLVIIMAVDVIYFYEAWAVWMHKKFNYKTVFKPHHH